MEPEGSRRPGPRAAEAALPLIAWSRIWSPLVPDDWRAEAWEALALPGSWSALESDFWEIFEMGLPVPRVPLLLHSALHRDGGGAREDWMRVIAHLGLDWDGGHRLPPDHLGAACEVLACAVGREEKVLVHELCERYLLPWCQAARSRLVDEDGAVGRLPERFEVDLRALEGP